MQDFAKVSCVSATTDIWTSANTQSFITVTIHCFVNETLHSFVLTTKQLNESHSAEYLSETLKEIFEEWKLTSKITAVVTDRSGKNRQQLNFLELLISHVWHTTSLLL
jgi:hypothetical protein